MMTNKNQRIPPTSASPELAQFIRKEAALQDVSIGHLIRRGLSLLTDESQPEPKDGALLTDRIPIILLTDEYLARVNVLIANGQFKNTAQVIRAAASAYQKAINPTVAVQITKKENVAP